MNKLSSVIDHGSTVFSVISNLFSTQLKGNFFSVQRFEPKKSFSSFSIFLNCKFFSYEDYEKFIVFLVWKANIEWSVKVWKLSCSRFCKLTDHAAFSLSSDEKWSAIDIMDCCHALDLKVLMRMIMLWKSGRKSILCLGIKIENDKS
jgi:hypothetical protein